MGQANLDSSPSRLELSFLGIPRVNLPDGQGVRFSVDNSLLLLAYLSINAAQPHRRDELAALFYPDQDKKQASQNLRQALLRLRRAIGDEAAVPPYLLGAQLTLQWNPESSFGLDIAEFEMITNEVRQHRHRRLEVCRACLARLARAVDLYRGEFLTGLERYDDSPYADWLLSRRSELQSKAVWALHALAQHHRNRDQYDECLSYTNRALLIDPLDEVAVQIQMQALAARGERSVALRRYQDLNRRLLAELDTTPEPETIRLANLIRTSQTTDLAPRQRRDTLLTHQSFSPTALPNTLVPFVGRQTELSHIARLLSGQDCRLLTILGPGGIGKTRLAMRAAADDAPSWKDGAWLVLLDDPANPVNDLEEALLQALGLQGKDPVQRRFQINDFLRPKECLLVLDNFERVADQSGLVKSLLDHAQLVKIIVTSRQRLGLRGEQVIELGGLDYPIDEDGAGLKADDFAHLVQAYSALQLFEACARGLDPNFQFNSGNTPAVLALCRRLEGLPLGLELAAGWTRYFQPAEILERFQENIDFLRAIGQDLPPRHASLRAVFEYSWRMLSEKERLALKALNEQAPRLAFTQALTITQVEMPVLVALRDKSLLEQTADGQFSIPTYLRPFIAEKLAMVTAL